MNEKAEFAVKTLREYARQQGFSTRNTSDLSTLEEWLIIELLRVKKLTTPDTSSSVFLVQHKETLINYGLFSDRKKAENYINKNTDLFKIQEIEIA